MTASFKQAALELPTVTPAGFDTLRRQARERWINEALPSARNEHWKYTSLNRLTRGDYLHTPVPEPALPDLDAVEIEGLAAMRLVFVNGDYCAALSQCAAPAGVNLMRLAEIGEDDSKRMVDLLGSTVNLRDNLFTALNTYWLEDCVVIDIADRIDAGVLHLVHVGAAGPANFCCQRRVFLRLGEGARASLIEHFISAGSGLHGFVSDVTELKLAPSSHLNHYRLHLEHEASLYIGGVYGQIERDAAYDGFIIGLGSQLKRLDLDLQHRGAGSYCRLNGVYLPRRKQHIDLQVNIEHEQPHGTTEETFRGIIDDDAQAVFNGRIHIHRKAQKTKASLSNRNLLLSDRAEINTKPELEIYADDVQCAHGATVSQLDPKALYYLRSRGIERQEAEVLLSFAFINELIEGITLAPLHGLLRPILRDWFGTDDTLTRHLA